MLKNKHTQFSNRKLPPNFIIIIIRAYKVIAIPDSNTKLRAKKSFYCYANGLCQKSNISYCFYISLKTIGITFSYILFSLYKCSKGEKINKIKTAPFHKKNCLILTNQTMNFLLKKST